MFGGLDEYSTVVDYYSKIMTHDDALLLKDLVARIPRSPANVRQYLQRHCQDVRGLEEFFKDNSYQFFVENGRVTLNDDLLEAVRDEAVEYFKGKLKSYDRPIHFMELKKTHLDKAPDSIGNFVARFYPGKEFKHFLRSRPDVFNVYKDHTVSLIEVDSVAFFAQTLKKCGEFKVPFLNFRGNIGQAPRCIQNYINNYFPGDEFQHFLRSNSHVFLLDQEFKVSLVPLA